MVTSTATCAIGPVELIERPLDDPVTVPHWHRPRSNCLGYPAESGLLAAARRPPPPPPPPPPPTTATPHRRRLRGRRIRARPHAPPPWPAALSPSQRPPQTAIDSPPGPRQRRRPGHRWDPIRRRRPSHRRRPDLLHRRRPPKPPVSKTPTAPRRRLATTKTRLPRQGAI